MGRREERKKKKKKKNREEEPSPQRVPQKAVPDLLSSPSGDHRPYLEKDAQTTSGEIEKKKKKRGGGRKKEGRGIATFVQHGKSVYTFV